MSQLLPLRLQIFDVALGRLHFDGDPLDNVYAVSFKPNDFLWIIGHQPDVLHPQVNEDLGADTVITQIRLESQLQVSLHRVLPPVLPGVGLQLIDEPDAAPFLAHVEYDSPP